MANETDLAKLIHMVRERFDWRYVKEVVNKLSGLGDSKLGFRLAGGDAERRAAEYIQDELSRLGCREVFLEEVPVDKWIFKEASIEIREEKLRIGGVALAGHPGASIEGIIQYVGRGLRSDYSGIDISGKVALVEMDDTLYDSPLPVIKEAMSRGAIAVVATMRGRPPDALFTMDGEWFEGLIPTIIISQRDFGRIKELSREGGLKVAIDIDVEVGDGVGYNVIGLSGSVHRENLIISAHHDAHFKGAADNASGVALMLSLCNALSDIDTDKTIIYISFTAEEYGRRNTLYDYLIGSHHFLMKHAEITERNILFMNFDVVGLKDAPVGITYTPELESYIRDNLEKLNEHLDIGYKTMSRPSLWLDQWPAVYNGLSSIALTSLSHKEYYEKYYHTQLDGMELLNEKHFKAYMLTALTLINVFIRGRVPSYDFTPIARQSMGALNMGVFSYAIDMLDELENHLGALAAWSTRLTKIINEVNEGRYPSGIDIKRLKKGVVIARKILLKTIYEINPLQLAPRWPSIKPELYRDLFKILETAGDETPKYMEWTTRFSKETVEWILDKILEADNWAYKIVPRPPIEITASGVVPREEELIHTTNQEIAKLIEGIETATRIIRAIVKPNEE